MIKSLVDHDGNKKAAALKLGCTVRSINRMIIKYKEQGKEAFVHGNRGRRPKHTISDSLAANIISLYNSKYYDATFSYACELLVEHDEINISPSAFTNIMYKNFITSPRTTKVVCKRLTRELRQLQKETRSKRKTIEIQTAIVNLKQAHSKRSRCTYFGEMLQMDASLYLWFGDTKTQLHIAIDDCTGQIVGTYFDKQETLHGYYNVFHQILTSYGIPAMFYTDRRTLFEYKQSRSTKVEQDTFTQYNPTI